MISVGERNGKLTNRC